MGLSIGQSAQSLGGVSRPDVGDIARQAAVAAAVRVRPGGTTSSGRGPEERPGVNPSASGLGQSAVNGPAAALRTIDQGVASARQLVPDVQDIVEILRERFTESEAARTARLEEQRAAEAETEEEVAARPEERLLPEPSPRTSEFRATDTNRETQETTQRTEALAATGTEGIPLPAQRPTLNVLV